MVRALPVLLSLFVGLVAAGCGGGDGDGEEDSPSIAGSWDVRILKRVYYVSGVRHEETLTGTINLTDASGLLSGTCSIAGFESSIHGVFNRLSAARTMSWSARTVDHRYMYKFEGIVSTDLQRISGTHISGGSAISWSATRR